MKSWVFILGLILAAFLFGQCRAAPKPTPSQNLCGLSTTDWCPSPPGDSCGEHKNEKSCRADPKCKGMPYRGESAVTCMEDGKGFWFNCPTVGCVSR